MREKSCNPPGKQRTEGRSRLWHAKHNAWQREGQEDNDEGLTFSIRSYVFSISFSPSRTFSFLDSWEEGTPKHAHWRMVWMAEGTRPGRTRRRSMEKYERERNREIMWMQTSSQTQLVPFPCKKTAFFWNCSVFLLSSTYGVQYERDKWFEFAFRSGTEDR